MFVAALLFSALARAAEPVDVSLDDAPPPLPLAQQAPTPYANIDYTAYTLGQGVMRAGLQGAEYGVNDRVQVGTSLAADALAAPNLHLKIDMIQGEKMDTAVTGSVTSMVSGPVQSLYLRGSVIASRQIVAGLSLHEELSAGWLRAAGVPDADSGMLSGVARWVAPAGTLPDAFTGGGQFVNARLATDYRFNRRDTVILQASSLIWGDSTLDLAAPTAATAGVPTAAGISGFAGPSDAYTASIGYQASVKNLDVRVGVGISSVPGAWLLQSIDVAYRFGGARKDTLEPALASR